MTISVLRRFRLMPRRRVERSDARRSCRDASSSGSAHRTAAEIGHVLEIQPCTDLAKARQGGRGAAAQGTLPAHVVKPRLPLLGAGDLETLWQHVGDRRAAGTRDSSP